MKPAVPGMPASETMNSVISAASAGRVRARPVKSSSRSASWPRWVSAMITPKAPRFVNR